MSLSTTELELAPAAPVAENVPPAEPAPPRDHTELVIRPRRGWIPIDWKELWTHRELLYFLVWRDVKVRYKQAVLGFAWAILNPVIQVAIFTMIFFRMAKLGSLIPQDIPAPLYVFAGLIPWLMVSQAIGNGGLSLVSQQNLLAKIYMPRLLIPAATIGSALVDMGISFGVFFIWMAIRGVVPSWHIVFLPLIILLTIVSSLGIAFSLAALTVCYRDLKFLIPFLSQIWMWLSAVAYPPSLFRNHQWMLAFNPLFGIFDTYRALIFKGVGWHPMHLLSSIVINFAILTFGLFYFRRVERRFADIA